MWDVVPVTCTDAEAPQKLNPALADFSTEWPQLSELVLDVLCECVTDTVSVTSVGTPMNFTGTHDALIAVTMGTHGGGGGGACRYWMSFAKSLSVLVGNKQSCDDKRPTWFCSCAVSA